MPVEISVALISSIIGGFLVAVVNHLFTRKKTEAETEKIRAEAEKLRAEAEKIRSEISKASSEAAKLGDTVERAASLISHGYLSESETSKELIQEVVRNIHGHLRERKSDRIDRLELVRVISPILKDDAIMSEFMVDVLISRGYLIETSPDRYEISRAAIQKFILGGVK